MQDEEETTEESKNPLEELAEFLNIDQEELFTMLKGVDGKTPTEDELIALIKPLIPQVSNGLDGKDGLKPTNKELLALIKPLIPKVQNGIDGINGSNGKDGSPDTGEDIVTKINELGISLDTQIDASHIKNLPKEKGNNYYGGSLIKELVAGANISIDNSSISYPVISSTGGGGSGTGFKYIGSDVPDTTNWEVNDLWYDTSTEVS